LLQLYKVCVRKSRIQRREWLALPHDLARLHID
jgi:hypothetical protein